MISTTRTLNLRASYQLSTSTVEAYANFNNMKNYLHTFSQPFSIIAISETWVSTEKGIDFE